MDGYRLLYADGVFCEFAVFTRAELSNAAASGARIVWERHGAALQLPAVVSPAAPPAVAWQLGEALTSLYVAEIPPTPGSSIRVYGAARLLDAA